MKTNCILALFSVLYIPLHLLVWLPISWIMGGPTEASFQIALIWSMGASFGIFMTLLFIRSQ